MDQKCYDKYMELEHKEFMLYEDTVKIQKECDRAFGCVNCEYFTKPDFVVNSIYHRSD